jgi:integrase
MRSDETPAFYSGDLAPFMAEYMQYNRKLGKKYDCVPYLLVSFSAQVTQKGIPINGINKSVVMDWATGSQIPPKLENQRLYILKQFLVFMQQKGFSVYIPPKLKFVRSGFVPYIYTRGEIAAFFYACDTFRTKTERSKTPTVMPLLFRMLYCCGLRVSEATNLKIRDVNLLDGILAIRHGKFDKDRLVPMSADLLCYCRRYYKEVHLVSTEDAHFFTKRDGSPYLRDYVHDFFTKILWNAGISRGGRGVGPRVHDFRHTFAVYALKQMHDNGMDIYCSLPLLSTYLGHASVAATERYVRLTQEIFPEIVSEVSLISSYVIPEVKINEETN